MQIQLSKKEAQAYSLLEESAQRAETSRRQKYHNMRETHGDKFYTLFDHATKTYDKFRSKSSMRRTQQPHHGGSGFGKKSLPPVRRNFVSRHGSTNSNHSSIVGGNNLTFQLPKQQHSYATNDESGDLPIPRADPKVNPVSYAHEQATSWLDSNLDKTSPRQMTKLDFLANGGVSSALKDKLKSSPFKKRIISLPKKSFKHDVSDILQYMNEQPKTIDYFLNRIQPYKKKEKNTTYFDEAIKDQNKKLLQKNGETFIPYDPKNKDKFKEDCRAFFGTKSEQKNKVTFTQTKEIKPKPQTQRPLPRYHMPTKNQLNRLGLATPVCLSPKGEDYRPPSSIGMEQPSLQKNSTFQQVDFKDDESTRSKQFITALPVAPVAARKPPSQMSHQNLIFASTNLVPIQKKDNVSFEDYFKKMCKEPKSCHIIRAKLSRGKFYQYLIKSFATIQNERPGGKSFIAEKFLSTLDFTLPMDYNTYVDNVEMLINKDPQKLMKLAFSIFDFNNDGFIDEIDIYCVMKLCDFQSLKSKKKKMKMKNFEPKDEVDKFIEKTDNIKNITQSQSNLEQTIQNDLTILSLYLDKKLNKFTKTSSNMESIENRIQTMYKHLEELNFQKMRSYLIKKCKQYQEKQGYSQEMATAKIDILIEQIHRETDVMLNAVESYKSIKMEPEQRAFYEGEHLISDPEEEEDIFSKPKSNTEKYLAKLEAERLEKEKLLAGMLPSEESIKEEYVEEPTHPYQIVFGEKMSAKIIDKLKVRQQLYQNKAATPSENERGRESIRQQKISFEEFENIIEWPKIFPYIIIEFLSQISDTRVMKNIDERLQQRKIEQIKARELSENGYEIKDAQALQKLIKIQRVNKSNASKIAQDIEDWKLKLGQPLFDKFFNSFKIMAKNWKELPLEHQFPYLVKNGIDYIEEEVDKPDYKEIYLTRESIEAQMPILWGIENFKWLPTRFYFYLSANKNLKRIYFGDYMDKIYSPLFQTGKKEQNLFCFKMLDSDEDGAITSADFVYMQNTLDPKCYLWVNEIKPMIKYYSATHLQIYGLPKPDEAINYEKYKELFKDYLSCIFDEIKAKLLQKTPGEMAHRGSCFVNSYKLPDGSLVKSNEFKLYI